ncbi:MAG: PKD domain-containing protein [Saprospirales bacterium]|nr:PKD domain-containing protein [Saprospirales bacterium]
MYILSNGLTTNFTNASLNGVTYNWNFGNGQISTLQHPNVTYSTAGNYNVCLTTTNACDKNKVGKMIAVSACDTVNKYDIYNVINTVPQINKKDIFMIMEHII